MVARALCFLLSLSFVRVAQDFRIFPSVYLDGI
jgi:hypothetical protein